MIDMTKLSPGDTIEFSIDDMHWHGLLTEKGNITLELRNERYIIHANNIKILEFRRISAIVTNKFLIC